MKIFKLQKFALVQLTLLMLTLSLFTGAGIAIGGQESPTSSMLQLSGGQASYKVTPHLLYFEDSENKADAASVIKGDWKDHFVSVGSSAQRGYNNKWHWLKVSLANHDSPTSKWFLSFLSSELAIADFYQVVNGKLVKSANSGYLVSGRSKLLLPRQGVFELTLPSATNADIYIHVRSNYLLELNMQMVDEHLIEEQTFIDNLFFGFFFGCIMALLLYNLFLFIALRDNLYLYYVLFISSLTVNIAALSGFLFLFLPDPSLINWSLFLELSRIIFMLAAVHFSQLFLHTRLYSPRLNIVLYLLSLAMIGKTVATTFFAQPTGIGDDFFVASTTLGVMLAGYKSYRQGYAPAKPFLLAWGCLLGSVTVWSLAHSNLIPSNYLAANAPLVGTMLEMILMSLALGQRYNLLKEADQKAAIEKQEKQRLSNLVRVLCHDIANPLAVIQGTATMAIGKDSDPQRNQKLWEKIGRASAILAEMIDQIRQMEAYRAGKMKPQVEPVSLKETFNNMLFIFDARLKKKKLEIIHNLGDSDEDIYVLADKTMLGNNVINNIISNAIKFSFPGGKIMVEAFDLGDEVHVQVSDQGIGMPTTLMEKLFDPSAETSRRGTNHEEGTGFGMPLVKSVTESLEGNIKIESKDKSTFPHDHGTTVHIYLPRYDKSQDIEKLA